MRTTHLDPADERHRRNGQACPHILSNFNFVVQTLTLGKSQGTDMPASELSQFETLRWYLPLCPTVIGLGGRGLRNGDAKKLVESRDYAT